MALLIDAMGVRSYGLHCSAHDIMLLLVLLQVEEVLQCVLVDHRAR